jgi:hypothetical protein
MMTWSSRLGRVAIVGTLAVGALGWAAAPGAGAASTTTTTPPVPTSARPLPTPRPADFDASGSISAFPMPDTPTASPNTTITFRGPGASGAAAAVVTGSESGPHSGRVQLHPDGRGATFVPDTPFTPGERVMVATTMPVRGATDGKFSFGVARPAPFPAQPLPAPPSRSSKKTKDDLLHFTSRPDLTAPDLSVNKDEDGTAPGDVLLTPTGGDTTSGLLIVDTKGQPVWIGPRPGTRVLDLQEQQYRGQPVLTWYQGSVVDPGVGQGSVEIADQSYQPIAHVDALNGYAADLHDVLITPQNTALLLIYNPILVDATSVHGAKRQRVLEPVIQEIDVATGTLLFEWHGLSSIPLSASYQPVPKSGRDTFDYVHPNSVDLDRDGNLLVSGRHTWTIDKIDRTSGVLDWQLGGKQNNFSMPASATVAWQHDARENPDGTLSVFDNGAAGSTVTHKTRGEVLRLDEAAMTAKVVRAYPAPPKVQSTSQGSFRLLADGDWFAGWGDQPEYTEFAPDGTVVYDVKFPTANGTVSSYRAIKVPWTGHPSGVPTVAARRSSADELSVAVSWNGATDVAEWQVLAGPDRADLVPITTVSRSGFETTIHATTNQPYVAVRADDATGNVLATSDAVAPRS